MNIGFPSTCCDSTLPLSVPCGPHCYAERMHEGRLNRMPAARRRRLMEVAADEFASSGYVNASLNRIIATCGMSKSSFYYVIDSKGELFDFVMRELIRDVSDKFDIPAPREFDGDDFWQRVEAFFAELTAVSAREASALTLGRMFYAGAPDDGAGAAAELINAVRGWVEELLRVGRRCGAVRDDLPEALQYEVAVRLLQVFDEWTVAHYEELTAGDREQLAVAQFATVKRVLAAV
ncbi:MAG: TetR/AcrR family transcriptional regulator [Mycolicibacterium mageritense]|nr:MAG: TetR/AcrR family transcriptional regulator [Mycolicibacterium mageritense]